MAEMTPLTQVAEMTGFPKRSIQRLTEEGVLIPGGGGKTRRDERLYDETEINIALLVQHLHAEIPSPRYLKAIASAFRDALTAADDVMVVQRAMAAQRRGDKAWLLIITDKGGEGGESRALVYGLTEQAFPFGDSWVSAIEFASALPMTPLHILNWSVLPKIKSFIAELDDIKEAKAKRGDRGDGVNS